MRKTARTIGFTGLAAILMAPAATPSFAQDETSVAYEDAIGCSALYTFFAATLEGEPEEEVLDEVAIRWLLLAMRRDGSEDGNRAVGELEDRVNILLETAGEMGGDEDKLDTYLSTNAEYCDAKQELVAAEFEAVDTSEE